MSLLDHNSQTVGPEKCSIAKAQDKNLKIAFIDMLEVLKEDTNEFTIESMET